MTSSFSVCHSRHICTHIWYICMFYPYDVTYMHVSRVGSSVLDNQLTHSPLGMSHVIILVFLHPYSSLCRVESSWAFPCLVWNVCWCHCCWKFMLVRLHGRNRWKMVSVGEQGSLPWGCVSKANKKIKNKLCALWRSRTWNLKYSPQDTGRSFTPGKCFVCVLT